MYRVRSKLMDTSGGGGTTGEVTEVIKDAAGLEFQRGKLKLDDNGLVFAPSINDSKLMDMASTYLSTGPIDPVKLVYSPYETSFRDAERYDGYQEISYSSIEAVSVVQKGKVSEVAIDSNGLPDSVYLRFRVDVGTYFWPVYDGNKKSAKKIGEEILKNAKKSGGAEEFKAGGLYSGPTSSVDMSEQVVSASTQSSGTGTSKQFKKDSINGKASNPTQESESGSVQVSRAEAETGSINNKTGNSSQESDSNKIGGGKILLAGVLLFIIMPIFVVLLGLPNVVESASWGLGVILLLFGSGRLIRGYL